MDDLPFLSAIDVSKSYALGTTRVSALRGVDVTVQRGEMVAIAGPSGSGKTTLLNLLGLLDVPDAGRIALDRLDVAGLDDRDRTLVRRRRLGFVFQEFNLVPVLSAIENVAYPLAIDGVPVAERRRRAAATLEAVGLGDRAEHRPDQLSGGQRQRVAIARAVVHEPDAVLADEPTGNLDSSTATEIVELMESINRTRGTTFLVATHDGDLIRRLPRCVRLVDGTVVDDERKSTA